MSDYFPQIDFQQVQSAWQSDAPRWKKYVIKKYSKKAAKKIAADSIGFLTGATVSTLFEIPGAISTHSHIKHLEELKPGDVYVCSGHFDLDNCKTCHEIIEYIINKKKSKRFHKGIGVAPGLGALRTMYGINKGIYKTLNRTKGSNRAKYSQLIYQRARNGCQFCCAIIAELIGNYKTQESWMEMFALLNWDKGHEIIFEKLAST